MTNANGRSGEKHLLAQVATHHAAGHADRLGHQLAAEVPIKRKPGRALVWKSGAVRHTHSGASVKVRKR